MLDTADTSRSVLADKGYVNGEREARLARAGLRMFIQCKGGKDKPMLEMQSRRNYRSAETRATLHLNWMAAAYNLRRLCYLKRRESRRSDAESPPANA